MPTWTTKEIEILKQYYNSDFEKCRKLLPTHTVFGIQKYASKHKLAKRQEKIRWTHTEINIIKKYYKTDPRKCYALLTNRTPIAVYTRWLTLRQQQ